jgi:hypothetical protein
MMKADDVTMVVAILMCVILLLAMLACHYYAKNLTIRKSFMEYKLMQNEVVSLYVDAAREKRDLTLRFNKLKVAISQSFFKERTMPEVIAWYETYGIEQGWAVEQESKESIVAHNIIAMYKTTKKYDEEIRAV